MKRTVVSAALVSTSLLSALVLAGCGSDEPVPQPVQVTTPAGGDRSETALEKALLAVEDLPEGYVVQPEAEEDGATPVARSEDPRCDGFVRLINAETLPGSTASALVAFAGGAQGPFVEEWLEAMGDATAVADVQAQLERSVDECGAITVSLPGSGAAEMELSAVDAPAVGENTVAYRMTATDGSFGGLEITFVHAGVDDTLLTMNFVSIDRSEIEGLVSAAHAKATTVLETSAG